MLEVIISYKHKSMKISGKATFILPSSYKGQELEIIKEIYDLSGADILNWNSQSVKLPYLVDSTFIILKRK